METKSDITIDTFINFNFAGVVMLPIIAVYQSPKDYPGKFVARLWDIGGKPTRYAVIKGSLEEIRQVIPGYMHWIGRTNLDDPVMIETWI